MAAKARQGQLVDLRLRELARRFVAVAHFVLLFRSSNRYSQNAQRTRSVLKKNAEITIFVFFQPLSPSTRTSYDNANTNTQSIVGCVWLVKTSSMPKCCFFF